MSGPDIPSSSSIAQREALLQQDVQESFAAAYTVIRQLGSGGASTVYLARDLRRGCQVALKVLRAELAISVQAERFLREIDITRNLRHPNILALYDAGRMESQAPRGGVHLFFTMPFVQGITLRERLEKEPKLPIPEALRIALELGEALQYAHEMGVLHRDIKPSNIFLTVDHHTVLADFGLARAMTRDEEILTASGTNIGTPFYMSPEQVTNDPQLDARSDQYTLSCVVYEMLTGDPPFGSSGGVRSLMMRHITERPSSMRTVRDTIPEHIDSAILRALEKTPADRFVNVQEFTRALRIDRPDTQVPMWGPLPAKVDQDSCFVLMPFGEQDNIQEAYRDHIVPVLEECGFQVYRADDIFGHNEVIRDIWTAIGKARLIIADVTGRNANVFYELGMAHAIGKDVIILAQKREDIPFDVTHLRYIKYEYTPRGVQKLKDALLKTVSGLVAEHPT
jgi:serine/threonine protein kinase